MTARSVQINLDAAGCGSVLVDGTDVAHAVTGLRFTAEAGGGNRLTLDVMLPEVAVAAEVEVEVSDAARAALLVLGWRPPADDDSRGGF